MASLLSFKLSLQEPRNSALAQLKIWIDELSSYEHELSMEIASLTQMVQKRYTAAASAAVRQYEVLLSDVRQIREMFEKQKDIIKSDELPERPLKRVAR